MVVIPDDLKCRLCYKLVKNCVMISCCGLDVCRSCGVKFLLKCGEVCCDKKMLCSQLIPRYDTRQIVNDYLKTQSDNLLKDKIIMEQIENKFKNKISLKEFEVTNTSSSNIAGNVTGQLKGFDVKEAEDKLKISVIKMDAMDMEFDLIGYDAALANALRRILVSDIPSMGIEKVHVYLNTSIMQDEVMAHRLGLLPLTADPRLFSYPPADWTPETGTEKDTLEFSLAIKCTRSSDPSKPYKNEKVFTKHFQWVPRGEQEKWIGTTNPFSGAPDILVNKLRPGHEMDLKVFAVKGTGRDHAKFSPVATAFYRMLPSITITKPVVGEAAVRLQNCFSPGVIGLEEGPGGSRQAVVVNDRIDSCSRNVYRYEDLRECVVLEKVKDHFIFTVESVGANRPDDLVSMAWDVIIEKCDHFIEELQKKK